MDLSFQTMAAKTFLFITQKFSRADSLLL